MQRHLLYHLYPLRSNNGWLENVSALTGRLGLFSGRRLVAVATGPRTVTFAEACRAFGRYREQVELFEVRNDDQLWEVATFLPLFERIAGAPAGDVFLWAHAKGVRGNWIEATTRWREALYSLYMDYWPEVEKLLERFPVVGAFKKLGPGWPPHQSLSTWHYSGSWCWYRAGDLFGKSDWRRIDQFMHGIEPYPSLHFTAREAGCLFWEDVGGHTNLYNLRFWEEAGRSLQAWKETHERYQG